MEVKSSVIENSTYCTFLAYKATLGRLTTDWSLGSGGSIERHTNVARPHRSPLKPAVIHLCSGILEWLFRASNLHLAMINPCIDDMRFQLLWRLCCSRWEGLIRDADYLDGYFLPALEICRTARP